MVAFLARKIGFQTWSGRFEIAKIQFAVDSLHVAERILDQIFIADLTESVVGDFFPLVFESSIHAVECRENQVIQRRVLWNLKSLGGIQRVPKPLR